MINDFQRRILAEAAKFGGVFASNSQKIAKELNEAPALGSDTATTMFGYSKPQFEAKIRQLLQKMGFEKGITRMMTKPNGNMVLYFANKAKARDFAMTFEGMTRRMSGGNNIVQFTTGGDMTPDQKKFATGAEAMVELMLNKLKKESLDNESYIFMALENLHEEYVTEGGVKAALEDFMYSLPKAAIAELKPLMKTKGGVAQQVMRLASITAILNKHGVVKKFMGFNTANLVNDYFDTFHGESVEENGEVLSEGSAMIPFKKILKGVNDMEGPFLIVVMRKGGPGALIQKKVPGRAALPAHINHMLSTELQKYEWKAIAIENAKGKIVNVLYPNDVLVKAGSKPSFKEEVELELDEDNWGGGFETSREAQAKVQAGLKADAKKRQALILSALQQVIDGKMSKPAFKKLTGSSFGDIMSLPFYSKKVKMKKEEVVEDGEIEEAKEKYLTGPGKKDPKRIIGIYTMKGKWIKDMGSEKEAANFVNKSWGESVEEEIEEATSIGKVLKAAKKSVLADRDGRNTPKAKAAMAAYKTAAKNHLNKEDVEVSEQFKAGDKVKVPHKGKMVSGKIVRFDDGGTSKAQQHGGGYVVDVGEPASITVPKQKVQKEEVEVSEAVNIGTNAYQIQRSGSNWEVWRLSYSQGSVRFADGRKGTKLRSDFKSYEDALAYAKKDAGVKEEVEIEEGVRIMTGAETMIKNAGGSSMVSNFRKIKSEFGKKPVGSVIVLTTEKDPESHEIKVYDPKDFQNMVKGLAKKVEPKVGSKGSWSDGEVTVIGIKE